MYIFYNNYEGYEYQVASYFLPRTYDVSWWRVPGISHEEE